MFDQWSYNKISTILNRSRTPLYYTRHYPNARCDSSANRKSVSWRNALPCCSWSFWWANVILFITSYYVLSRTISYIYVLHIELYLRLPSEYPLISTQLLQIGSYLRVRKEEKSLPCTNPVTGKKILSPSTTRSSFPRVDRPRPPMHKFTGGFLANMLPGLEDTKGNRLQEDKFGT